MAVRILPLHAAFYARKSTDDSDRDTDNKSVTRQVERARALAQQQGWAVDDEENNLGVRCVAAPVFNAEGRVEAALGISGTVAMVNSHTLAKYADAVKDAARRISAKLGYSAHSPAARR